LISQRNDNTNKQARFLLDKKNEIYKYAPYNFFLGGVREKRLYLTVGVPVAD